MDYGRRLLVGAALAGAWITARGVRAAPAAAAKPRSDESGPISLPELPWDEQALSPVLSARTIAYHYGEIHRLYVQNTNRLIQGTPFADLPLMEIVQKSKADPAQSALFNNAAQVWNHEFYWQSLAPKAGGAPGRDVQALIDDGFGSLENFRASLLDQATAQFGSGMVWLVLEKAGRKMRLIKTGNADTPIAGSLYTPLAACDVWEHAYYLDYQNRRDDYISAVLAKIFNWRFVEKNLEKA